MKYSSFLSALLLGSLAGSSHAADRPSFVLLLSDDQGWTGLSASMHPSRDDAKSDFYETKNIDRLAAQGMRFSDGYASSPVCSPSRHAIQFGKTPANLHVTYNARGSIQNFQPDESLANTLKRVDANYATAHFGKWHIKSHTPEQLGFDESDGSTTNDEGNPGDMPDDPKRTFEVSDRAAAFIDECRRSGKPFFVQVSYYADHLGFAATPETIAKYRDKPAGEKHRSAVFAAMNEELDRGVGIVLSQLERLGLEDSTYVFYTSDNGFAETRSSKYGKATPLLGSKGFVYEGGVRVPFIVRGPGIEPGTFSRVPVVGHDIFPTILDAAGALESVPHVVEGGSFLRILKDEGVGIVDRPDDFFVFHYPWGGWPGATALIDGDFKLVRHWERGTRELFDLGNDIGETTDRSAQLPGAAAELDGEMMDYLERVKADMPEFFRELTRERERRLEAKKAQRDSGAAKGSD